MNEREPLSGVEPIIRTETALIFPTDNERVIKVLRNYADPLRNIDQSTYPKRQELQGMVLRINRRYSDVYVGLQTVHMAGETLTGLGMLQTGEDIECTENEELGLIMEQLSKEDRLDTLLASASPEQAREYVLLVSDHIAENHIKSDAISSNYRTTYQRKSQEVPWGHPIQLQEALQNDLQFIKPIIDDILERGQAEADQGKDTSNYMRMFSNVQLAEAVLLNALETEKLQQYFIQRIEQQQIRIHHADLHPKNIFLKTDAAQRKRKVKLIDAIDFNNEYRYIDGLSDLAMLVPYIHLSKGDTDDMMTDWYEITNAMLKNYLAKTGQKDDACTRAVFNYYVCRKAFAARIMALIDGNPLQDAHQTRLDIETEDLEDTLWKLNIMA